MSSIRDIIGKLKAAGVDDAVILSVVEDIDGMLDDVRMSGGSPVDAAAEKRRAYDRDRKAKQRAVSGGKSGGIPLEVRSATPSPPDGPPSPPAPPLPPLNPPAPSATRRERGCALPANWQPNDQHMALGRELGRDVAWVAREAASFIDWAEANRNRPVGRKANWDAAFRNWLRNAAAKGQRGPPAGRATFGQRAREAAGRIMGMSDGKSDDHDFDGETLEARPSGRGPDIFDVQPDRGW